MASGAERGTRERIIEVAEAFLGDRGYDGTRLHLIAERVGIQKASLFHYFASKAELYQAVLGEGFEETEQAIRRVLETDATPAQKLRTLLDNYVDMVATHPARTKILLRQSLGDVPTGIEHDAQSMRVLQLVVDFIAEGQRAGVFAAAEPLTLVLGVIGMVAFFFTSAPVVAPGWSSGSTADVARVKRHVVDVVERFLAVRDGERGVARARVGGGR